VKEEREGFNPWIIVIIMVAIILALSLAAASLGVFGGGYHSANPTGIQPPKTVAPTATGISWVILSLL
jgi:hypothetical protein